MRKNPFQIANQVTSDGYIGRHHEIESIMSILGSNRKDSGVVISGLTRMGKTSLVKKCFEDAERNGSLKKNRIGVASITVSTLGNFSLFLKSMFDEIYDVLDNNDWIDDKIVELYSDAKAAQTAQEDRIYELDRVLKKLLKRLNKKDIKLVVLLDEFDDASRAFKYRDEETCTHFQMFRDYASGADYNITFILTCRISISKIDESMASGSNLSGVFTEKVLVGFTNEEREEFFDKIKECGVPLTKEQKEEYIWYAGRSPFLFSKIAYGILDLDERIPVKKISIQRIFFKYKKDSTEYFDSLIKFMKAEKMFSKFVQVFFGPVYDLTDADIEDLLDYGYIYHDTDEMSFTDIGHISDENDDSEGDIFTYQTLSQYFVEYIRNRVNLDNSIKIWAELIDAERELRSIVEVGLQKQFGRPKWKSELKNIASSRQHGYLYDVNKAEAFIKDSRINFGDRVSDNPLEVISINSLGNIINAFWNDQYSKIFNPPYREIQELLNELQQLNRARNPLAHGTPQYLSWEDKNQITNYCNKIKHVRRNGRH